MDAIISFNKLSDNSILAHNKITKFLASYFGGEVLDSKEKMVASMLKPYDRVFIVNGLECFCDYREEMRKFVGFHAHCKLFWATNDYKLTPSKQLRELMERNNTTLLTTVEEALHKQKFYKKYVYVNWNSLTMNKNFDYTKINKRHGLIYYGAYREGRVDSFEKYFKNVPYTVLISTTRSNLEKFRALNEQIKLFPPFGWANAISELSLFKYSIYIEDKASHKAYCSPANRFYECLSSGVVQFFDKECKHTFDRAGIDVSEYIVDSPAEIQEKMDWVEKDFHTHAEKQRGWVEDTKEEIANIIRGLNG